MLFGHVGNLGHVGQHGHVGNLGHVGPLCSGRACGPARSARAVRGIEREPGIWNMANMANMANVSGGNLWPCSSWGLATLPTNLGHVAPPFGHVAPGRRAK